MLAVGTTITVGEFGVATLDVLDGGRIVGAATLGDNANSYGQVVVDGANSLWEITGAQRVATGRAELVVSRGGRVTATEVLTIGGAGRVAVTAVGLRSPRAASTTAASSKGTAASSAA